MREVICADALAWLPEHPGLGAIVTSLPDAAEMNWRTEQWASWFLRAAGACLAAVPVKAACVFYQTDRKHAGMLLSKASLLFQAAAQVDCRLLWHKIVLRRQPGAVDLRRPGYSHLLAFSRSGRPGAASPDVIEPGRMIYPNAIGLHAAFVAVRFAASAASTIIDPFCGRGTVLAVAEVLGYRAIGVDIDSRQVDAARRLWLATTPPAMAAV